MCSRSRNGGGGRRLACLIRCKFSFLVGRRVERDLAIWDSEKWNDDRFEHRILCFRLHFFLATNVETMKYHQRVMMGQAPPQQGNLTRYALDLFLSHLAHRGTQQQQQNEEEMMKKSSRVKLSSQEEKKKSKTRRRRRRRRRSHKVQCSRVHNKCWQEFGLLGFSHSDSK